MRWQDCPDTTPAIVGVGEAIDRPTDLAEARHPVQLMAAAIRAARDDSGVEILPCLDRIAAVLQISWPYADAGAALEAEFGMEGGIVEYGAHGGHSPMLAIHEAALAISRGEIAAAAICGGEAYHSFTKAQKAGIELPWPEKSRPLDIVGARAKTVHPLAVKLGAALPVAVYPFYENATAAAWGDSPADAQRESGEIWSGFSQIAAQHPSAWMRKPVTARQVIEPTDDNRLISWPYTKFMVANPIVNQGAGVIVASLGLARELGIAEDRLVAIHGGVSAEEPVSFLDRDSYIRSTAQSAVLEAAIELAGGKFDAVELYSCFPCVPKMARRALGIAKDVPMSLVGGLTFFGGPLNNYMTHAACEMVRRLRGGTTKGLLYAQGGHLTWHHALVLGGKPGLPLEENYSVQAKAEALRDPVPPLDMDHSGDAMLETFTILYDKAGAPRHGVAILRTPSGGRQIAKVPGMEDIAVLVSLEQSPIGLVGTVRLGPDGVPEWQFLGRPSDPLTEKGSTQCA